MTHTIDIIETILGTCRDTLGLPDLQPGEDFFERGVSSLAIVELQIQIEEQLQLKVPTSQLMAAPSVDGWARAYLATAAAVTVPQ
ncbi:acyl carrier protein [Burkholderia ambifaria]|uniref:acyl carrier protein n=1 Tax=Burkholderia ambifaria TaxID=152480 RepID=UPI00158C8AE0|nr:acyl carrier protein [Burkholderia ambifaria]UEP26089.1 acyl carrier protein [Burkholderia ambifaria]